MSAESDDEPACNISGRCEALDEDDPEARSSMCEFCGASMVRVAEPQIHYGHWVRWDHPAAQVDGGDHGE